MSLRKPWQVDNGPCQVVIGKLESGTLFFGVLEYHSLSLVKRGILDQFWGLKLCTRRHSDRFSPTVHDLNLNSGYVTLSVDCPNISWLPFG